MAMAYLVGNYDSQQAQVREMLRAITQHTSRRRHRHRPPFLPRCLRATAVHATTAMGEVDGGVARCWMRSRALPTGVEPAPEKASGVA
jgi:hypothetical protein